jgi:hypothetical protein
MPPVQCNRGCLPPELLMAVHLASFTGAAADRLDRFATW